MAKIVFTDGTNYTVKQDSLIVMEENSTNEEQQTNVAVQVSTGTVDSHRNLYQGSKSQVIVAGASASLAPESAAHVRNDPKKDEHEILVKKGSANRAERRNRPLADYEKVASRLTNSMERAKEIWPPLLISPSNMSPIFMAANAEAMSSLPGRRSRRSELPAAGFAEPVFHFDAGLDQGQRTAIVSVTDSARAPITGWCSRYDEEESSRSKARRIASRSFRKTPRHRGA